MPRKIPRATDGNRSETLPRLSRIGLLGLLIVPLIAVFVVREVSDTDMWFHMAMGKQILANGSLPTTDQLSLLNFGRPISAHLWLFQILIAAGYPLAGAWWLLGVQVILLTAALATVYHTTRLWTSANMAWLLLLIVVIASSERFTVRPELVSFVMIAVYYYRLQQGKYHAPSEVAFFFVLQEIWTNTHGIFVIGPFMAGCYLLETLIRGRAENNYQQARPLAILTAALSAGCLITPNSWSNIKYTWRLLAESNPLAPKISNSTLEMAATLGESSRQMLPFWFYLFLVVAFLLTLLAALSQNRREVPIARTLIGCALLAASMTGLKNIPVFALVAAPLIVEYRSMLTGVRIRHRCSAAVIATMIAAAMIWSPRPACIFLKTWVPYRFGVGLSGDYVPLGLPAFLDSIRFSGSIFNSMALGGFYEYHGYPKRISFYDSRLQDYDPEQVIAVHTVVTEAARNPEGWYNLLHHYGFRGVLLGNHPDSEESGELLPLIATDPAWRLVYLDHAASFWIRTDHEDMPPALERGQVENLVNRTDNFAKAENLDFFLERTKLFPDLRLVLLEKATKQWENSLLDINLGLLKMQAGRMAEAEQIFTKVLKRKPDSRVTLATLAQLALHRGDRVTAEKHIRTALRYYPNDPDLRQNLDIILSK